jgi:hypothetical protein
MSIEFNSRRKLKEVCTIEEFRSTVLILARKQQDGATSKFTIRDLGNVRGDFSVQKE